MTDPHFFGYGSLVNRRTHDYAPALRATLRGWRREWRATAIRPAAFLTAIPDDGGEIDGLLAPVPGGDWAALDLREAGYLRRPATDLRQEGEGPGLDDVSIYAIPPSDTPVAAPCPVLLSYLDTVVQGFLAEYGTEGVARFFRSTGGWHLPIADDRAAPLYSRAFPAFPTERDLTDRWLSEVGATKRAVGDTLLSARVRRSA